MHLANRYATKVALLSFIAFAVSSFVIIEVTAQDPQQPSTNDKPAVATAAPAPSPPQKRLGTELDDKTLITNTDLITLTVTVTDTYGRYVSGLSKSVGAFTTNTKRRPLW